MPDPEIAGLIDRFRHGDRRALARLISRIESGSTDPALEALLDEAPPQPILGFTGPPGVGKSTLVASLVGLYCAQSLDVGIVAVDPTSPLTGGAVLGDRIRMKGLYLENKVFFRSMGSRGAAGGLAHQTQNVVRLLAAFGKTRILVESVGVGQGEVGICDVADTRILVKVPGLGDGVQAIKAGVLEVADIYVVNKADRPGADRLIGELHGVLALDAMPGDWTPPILSTVALEGQGVEALDEAIHQHQNYLAESGEGDRRRAQKREREFVGLIEEDARRRLRGALSSGGPLEQTFAAVREGGITPRRAAREALAQWNFQNPSSRQRP